MVPVALLLALVTRIEKLEEEIAALRRNSGNSSKPPSSDRHNPNKPEKKQRRGRGKRRPGGQKGHPGGTLERVADPDHVVEHPLPGRCDGCAASLRGVVAGGHEARQVFDLPEKITLEVTEHRAHTGNCPCCGKKVRAAFPEGVRAPVQYGARVRAVATYLHAYQLLPCERLGELFADLFGHRIGTATVSRLLLDGGDQAAGVVEGIREKIREAPFIHCDETGLSLCGRNIWLHTAATPGLTYLHVNEQRGLPALLEMRVLTGYGGTAVHDYFGSYYNIGDLDHSLCNAHHLRDLKAVEEDPVQQWARDMRALLLDAKARVAREKARERRVGDRTIAALQDRYYEIIAAGYEVNPEPVRRPGQKGRLKRGKALNLLDRFRDRAMEVMGFLISDLPFDNNQAERDLRMMKTKQKISGCFRSMLHAKAFANLRSVIASAKKGSKDVLGILTKTLADPAKALACLLET